MNDTTLPITNKTKSTTLLRRKKAPLRKGFALHDWKRLLQNSTDLAQRKGQPLRPIQPSEIKQHNKIHDGWISLYNKVYNIGPYLHYHPGGITILEECLGGDATSLFEEYHRWVNVDNLIGPLLLGYLVPDDDDENEECDNCDDKIQAVDYGYCASNRHTSLGMGKDKMGLPKTAVTKTANGDTIVSDFSMPPPKPVVLQKTLPSLLKRADDDDENEGDGVDLNPWEKK